MQVQQNAYPAALNAIPTGILYPATANRNVLACRKAQHEHGRGK
jgi:hypothetical protein